MDNNKKFYEDYQKKSTSDFRKKSIIIFIFFVLYISIFTIIDDYIKSGFVELIYFKNIEQPQLKAYNQCYERYNKLYDRLIFFDIDDPPPKCHTTFTQ